MSTRSGRVRSSVIDTSPVRTRKGVSPNRSPARGRKSSPARKSSPPARTSATRKSPSRKSPSRKPASKYPARKSPSRVTKESSEPDVKPAKSPAKRPGLKSDVSVKLEDLTSKLEIYRSTRSKRTEYSIKDVSSTDDLPDITKLNGVESFDVYGLRNRRSVEELPQRRSSRLKEFSDNEPDIRRSLSKSVSKSISKSISQSIDAYSDEENSSEDAHTDKSHSVTRKLATPIRSSVNKIAQISGRWEFGGRIGSALLIFIMPLTVFAILKSCCKTCTWKSLLDLSSLRLWTTWFSLSSFSIMAAQLALQAVIALVPVCGTKADRMDNSGTKYNFNAFFSCIITVNLLFGLQFFGVIDNDVLLEEYLRLAVASYIFAVLLSLFLYVKYHPLDDNELNPYGTTGYKLYDYFMGKEIHPFIKNLDVKIWISRVSNISALILAVLVFKQGVNLQMKDADNITISLDNYREILNNIQLQPTILLYSMMQIIYLLSFIMREYRITSSFYWQSEGVGYLQIVASALYPFYFTTVSKFVADNQVSLSTNILITASVIYVLGFLIMLLSNSIKYEFRRNPLQPSLANLDSMPTFHGKKLLVSGLWGFVRHPNYAGDILIQISLSLPGVLTHAYVAAAPAVLSMMVLLHRAWRDHARCKRRYGAAWQRYCKRVPSVIIPKVL
ncbi:delta(14)-sterol reductase TM7SF2 [Plodia interpunctella]|uniref:delta(14)-sterol reductase TM7SF2 n=1 Tax=Plodia interpunctella TaxID=58824 RepID=UPI0023686F70|nr:delta(14)-sterol reductase TM7SF2 [Plodia interpunctella]XP_053604273.1 delta(14)-sterol reductase TM7SF2 [Plodia interpunctella]